jgi:glutathione S-transferase
MEELGLPYELVWYDRGPDRLAPPEYLALHPAATAPVITDGDRTLAESAAIVEYICHRYADGRLTVSPDRLNFPDYVYWMHFNNNIQGLFFARLAMGDGEPPAKAFIDRREDNFYRYMEEQLGKHAFIAGDELTCADIMVMFNLTSIAPAFGRSFDEQPNIQAYVQRIAARPAYVKAMGIAGPTATRR